MWFFRSRQPVYRAEVRAEVRADGEGRAGRSEHRLRPMRLSRPAILLGVLAQLTACAGCSEVPTETPTETPTPGGTVSPVVTPTPTMTPTPVPTPCSSAFSEAQAGYLARQGMAYLLVEPQLMPYFLNRKSGEAGEWQGRMEQYVGCLTGFFRDGGVSIADPVSGCDVALAHASQHISEQDFDAYVGVFERALLAAPEGLFAPSCVSTYQNALEGILVDGSSTPDGTQAVKQAVVDPTQASAPTDYNLANQLSPVAVWDGVIGAQKLNYVDAGLNPFYANGNLNQRRHTYCLARYFCAYWGGPCDYGKEVLFSERNAQVCQLLQAAGTVPSALDCQASDLDLSPYLSVVATGEPDPVWYLQQFSLMRSVQEGGEQVCQALNQIHARYDKLITLDEGSYFLQNLSRGMSGQGVDSRLTNAYTEEQLNDPESYLNQIAYPRPALETPEYYAMPLYQQLYGQGFLGFIMGYMQTGMEQYSAYDPAMTTRQLPSISPGAYFLNDQPDVEGYDAHMKRWKQCMSRYLCSLTGGPCVYGDELEDALDKAAGYVGNELLLADELGGVCRPVHRDVGGVFHGMGITSGDYSAYISSMYYAAQDAYGGDVATSRNALLELMQTDELKSAVVEQPDDGATAYGRVGLKLGLSGTTVSWHLQATAEDERLAQFFSTSALAPGSRMMRCMTRLMCEALGGPCEFGADAAEMAFAPQVGAPEACLSSPEDLASLHAGLKAKDGTGISLRDFQAYVDKLDALYPGYFSCAADVCVVKKVLYSYCPAIVADPVACPEAQTVCEDTGPCD